MPSNGGLLYRSGVKRLNVISDKIKRKMMKKFVANDGKNLSQTPLIFFIICYNKA